MDQVDDATTDRDGWDGYWMDGLDEAGSECPGGNEGNRRKAWWRSWLRETAGLASCDMVTHDMLLSRDFRVSPLCSVPSLQP